MAFLLQSVMEWTGIASIPDFPFTLCPHAPRFSCDFLYGCSSTLLWTLQDGVTRSVNNSSSSLFVLPVGSTVSIFHLSLSTLSEGEKRLARNALRRARTLRIRGLLQCFGGTEYKEHIYIATEHCIPLAHYLLADVTHPSMLSPAFSSSSLLHGRRTEGSASNPSSVSSDANTTKREDGVWMADTNERTLFIQRELDAVCWEEESGQEEENENDREGEEEMGEESNEDAVSVHDHHQNSTKDTSQVTDDIQSVEEDLGGSTHRAGGTTAGGFSVPMQQRSDWLLFTYSGVSPKTLALGLKTITKGIHALHANQLHHGNIHPSCVFVAVRTGFWLLFGFEFLSEIGETQTARQAAIPPPSSSFSFSWGSGSHGNGGGAAGQEFGTENGLSFMSGGHFFARLKELEGQWKGKQEGSERSSSADNLSTRGRNNPLGGLVPPEFFLSPQAGGGNNNGGGGGSSSSHSAGLEKDDSLLSTSMSSVSKFWNTWMNAGPVSTKSAEQIRMHEHCTLILSSILEAPWKAAAWDAWGLSRLFYFSYVALHHQMHVLCGGAGRAAAQAAPSYASVSGAPANGVNEGAGRERWEQFSRSLCKVAEQLGADDPKERLQGASSFADLLRDEENDQEEERRGIKSSKSVAGICWSQEEYVKCMEMTELYPVLEADEKDQLVWRVIRELYTSLHTYITPSSSSSSIASFPSKESSGPVTHGGRNVWYLTPFSGMLWMIERIMANLFSHIPRRLVVGILLLGQHLLVPPRTRMGSEERGDAVAASYASAKESATAVVRDAFLPFDASPSSVGSPSAFSTVGAFWYDGTIGPLLAYMFRLREPFIRFQLLESTPLYAPYLSTSRWNDEIWPLLAECFRHASQSSLEILIATTKTAIFAAPYLSSAVLAEQVIPSIRKHLIAHADPSLRVNGLLCVSQILPSVGPDRCGPLAAEVYGRGVQDTHDAVRFVSVKGIQKCLQWMTPVQVVKYALPLVIPVAVDRYTPSREGSWAVIQECLHLFRVAYGVSVSPVGDSTAYGTPSRGNPPTSVTSARARSEEGRTSASSSSREPTPPVHDTHRRTSSSSCPSLEANPGSRYGERHSQAGGAVVPSLVGTAAVEMEEWHFHLPRDHFDALRLLKELDNDLHSPLLSAHPAPPRRRSLVSFSSPPTTTATETHKEPSRREEWKGTAPTPLTRIPTKDAEEEEEEWHAGQWSEETPTPTPSVAHLVATSSEWNRGHHDPKKMLHAVPAKGESSLVRDTNHGVTQVVSPTDAIPLAKAARRYSAMFLPPPTTPSLPSRLPGATAKSLDLERFSLGHSASPLASAGGGRGGGTGGSTTKSIPHRSTISSLRFTAAPKPSQDGKVGESENEAVMHSSLQSTGILSEGSEMEGLGGSRAEWGSRRGNAFGDSAMNSLAGSSTSPLRGSNSDDRGIKIKGSKRVGGGLGARKCD